jgi:glucan phosphoethanolaminetransferase (alkaline phosphatase superfamily)
MGYVMRTHFENVSLPLYQHMFLMDNWHLLWYAAIAVIAFNWRRLLQANVAPATVTVLAALGLVVVVFFYSTAAGGVDEESLLNRFLLHLVPALSFYLVLIASKRQQQTPDNPVAPAAAAAAPSA